ncbi:MAG: amidohydrolase, partial [Actinomycetota bacterium]|nr:amidohydrolase [Actinomycetota bacterium]
MPMPEGIGVVDLMIGFPHRDRRAVYDYLREGAKDAESKDMTFLAEYMFTDVPDEVDEDRDPVDVTIAEMDRFGVDVGLVGLTRLTLEARDRYPGRFQLSLEVNPNDVMESIRAIRRAKEEQDLAAVTFFPAGCLPQVPVDDPKAYAVYATCVELDIPIVVNAGIAGPRFPSACQHV